MPLIMIWFSFFKGKTFLKKLQLKIKVDLKIILTKDSDFFGNTHFLQESREWMK